MRARPEAPSGARDAAVRDSDDAYTRYLKGMDASMRVKVALTAAHVLSGGRAADMGMGSGGGSAALAGLYPSLEVVGVDLDPKLVERSRREHVLPNLSFQVGDIATPVLPAASFDAIFDSSVLHHVTSFNGYDRPAALRALSVQRDALREGGVLIVRDFLDPGPGDCELELPTTDGDDGDAPESASSAALLERFGREFRSLSDAPGFPLRRIESTRERPVKDGHRRYALSLRHAVEFVLRKDYRRDWVAEAQEEYTFATQAEIEAHFVAMGLRVLVSSPLRNPWILRHRFEGKFALTDARGAALDAPATNYVIVGQRVAAGEGVTFRDAGAARPSGFLELTHHEHVATGSLRDLVRRPGVTIDVIPFFSTERGIQVVVRTGVPRPITTSELASPAPCGSRGPEWQTEPLHARMSERPLGQTVEEALARVGIASTSIRSIEPGTTYYPSPGGIQEEVRSVFVEIEPMVVQRVGDDGSPWTSKGRLVAASAEQLLRAAQVGGLADARVEINVRTLLARRGHALGPWLADVAPIEADVPALATSDLTALLTRARRRAFRAASAPAGFLELSARRFQELDGTGNVLSEACLDVVTPARHGSLTVSCLPIALRGGVLHVGLDDDDLPAVQAFEGSSAILVVPAFRAPSELRTLRGLAAFVRERMASEHGLSVQALFELGGRYCPSPGMTPEVVYPFAASVVPSPQGRALHWVPLADAVASEARLVDGHLRVSLGRAAQAFDVESHQRA